MSDAQIDYSRPVGWWCLEIADYRIHPDTGPCKRCIPVFLPIPEGQRPLVEDEVTTGEAEVVTLQLDDDDEMAVSSVHPRGGRRTMGVMRWPGFSIRPIEIHINDCAQASARARIVTGATE